MTLTPTQIDALDDYTNAQMVKLLRYQIAELASGGPEASVTIGAHSYTMADMDKLRLMLKQFTEMAAVDADAVAVETAGCPVVSYQEPQA